MRTKRKRKAKFGLVTLTPMKVTVHIEKSLGAGPHEDSSQNRINLFCSEALFPLPPSYVDSQYEKSESIHL